MYSPTCAPLEPLSPIFICIFAIFTHLKTVEMSSLIHLSILHSIPFQALADLYSLTHLPMPALVKLVSSDEDKKEFCVEPKVARMSKTVQGLMEVRYPITVSCHSGLKQEKTLPYTATLSLPPYRKPIPF